MLPFLFLSLFLMNLSCQSGPIKIPITDYDQKSQAHGAAYTANAMEVREEMPGHSDWKAFPFYYKHCNEVGERYYYSKTSYNCTSLP